MCQVKKENTYVSGLAFWFEIVQENMEIMKAFDNLMLDFVLESEVKEKWKREWTEVFLPKTEGFCTVEIHVWSNFVSD